MRRNRVRVHKRRVGVGGVTDAVCGRDLGLKSDDWAEVTCALCLQQYDPAAAREAHAIGKEETREVTARHGRWAEVTARHER